MRRWWPLLCVPLLGCSSLGEGDTIVAIELRIPVPAAVEPGDTIWLNNDTMPYAVALNVAGEVVPATIEWLAGDTTLQIVGIDSLTTDTTAGSGKIQAQVGTLRSQLVTFTIRRFSDSLRITSPLVDTVEASETASAALVAVVESDTTFVSGTTIRYRVVPGDTAAARGKVEFQGGGLELRATTGSTGAPVSPVTLRVVSGAMPPDSVHVEVSATRPSGQAVPAAAGGRIFTILFE